MRRSIPCLTLLVLAIPANAQITRPLAITNAHILPISGKEIAKGVVLIRNGKITAIGASIEVPAGAKIVDAKGGTLMPGLVSAWSRAGLGSTSARPTMPSFIRSSRSRRGSSSRSGGGSASNQASKKVVSGLYARQKIFGELLEAGVTTLALYPSGGGFPGQGAILDPRGKTPQELTIDDDAFLVAAPSLSTSGKKVIRDALTKAKAEVAERKKPKADPKPAPKKAEAKKGEEEAAGKPEAKPATGKPKPGEKPAPAKPESGEKPQAKTASPEKKAPPKKKDPNIEVLADLLEGKRRVFMPLGSANELLHWLDTLGDTRFAHSTIIATSLSNGAGRLDEVQDKLGTLKAKTILMPPGLTSSAYSSDVINPAAILNKAGTEIGFILPDSKQNLELLFFQLMELVRTGLPREIALRAITLTPAKVLGRNKHVGSIEVGKTADLLLFTGDPLDPTSKLSRIWHKGIEVEDDREETR
ncbi:MAG: amidohydrolase family protein [Planctomycetota bacterium]|nr:amidohydrolase family protein [Planctomycetota bacterium]